MEKFDTNQNIAESSEKVVAVDRISRTVKGGRRIRFRALVVVGNKAGKVGVGIGKANDVQTAVSKAKNRAEKSMINVPVVNQTISHTVESNFGSTKILLKPAPIGHSIIAGGAVRSVVELAGINNIVSKSFGSSSAINNCYATFQALKELAKSPYIRKSKD